MSNGSGAAVFNYAQFESYYSNLSTMINEFDTFVEDCNKVVKAKLESGQGANWAEKHEASWDQEYASLDSAVADLRTKLDAAYKIEQAIKQTDLG